MALRGQWLSISGDHAAALARVGQAVLHLELSRCAQAAQTPNPTFSPARCG